MNTSKNKIQTFQAWGSIGLAMAVALLPQASKAAQAPVALGSASTFGVLAGSTVTTVPPTKINGDVGVFTGNTVTGAPTINGDLHRGDSTAARAQSHLTIAYNDAAGRTLAPISVSGNLGGRTLAPGLYKSTSSLAISSGDLTLDGQGNPNAVWVFQMASTLTTTAGRRVILVGGAKAGNVYWQVGSSATLGTNSVFKGTLLVYQSISISTGARLEGRALARIGAVTLDANTITVPPASLQSRTAIASMTGKTLVAKITDGSHALPSRGKFQFVAATGKHETYRLVPLHSNVSSSKGNYTYVKTSPTTGKLSYDGTSMTLTFASATAGNYSSRKGSSTQIGSFVISDTLPDANDDGLADIYFQNADGTIVARKMNGTDFGGKLPVQNAPPADKLQAFGQGDFDRDGHADIALQNKTSGRLEVWFMNGTKFLRSQELASGKNTQNAGSGASIADFDADGGPDVLLQDDKGVATVWHLKGIQFQKATELRHGKAAGRSWEVAGTGDFNADGQPDIVWQNSDGRVMVWKFHGTKYVGDDSLRKGSRATSQEIRGVGDFNFDGKTDLLWQNKKGDMVFWFLDDTTFLSSQQARGVSETGQVFGPR